MQSSTSTVAATTLTTIFAATNKYSSALSGSTFIDLYDNRQLAQLAVAAFSHELSFRYPLSDEQMARAFETTDRQVDVWRQGQASEEIAPSPELESDGTMDRMTPNEERVFPD